MTGAMGAERSEALLRLRRVWEVVSFGAPSTALTGDGTLQAFHFRPGKATIRQLQALEIDGSGVLYPPFPARPPSSHAVKDYPLTRWKQSCDGNSSRIISNKISTR